jgi:hypothetical protein
MITINGNTMAAPDYNEITSIADNTEISGLAEPVAISEIKAYMRLEGWSDEISESTEFSFDDDLIAELISSSRQYIEQMANVSLIPHQLEVVLTNAHRIELPFSPIDEVTEVVGSDGLTIDSDLVTTVGNDRKFLKTPVGFDLVVSYTTKVLIDSRPLLDIKRLVAALYDNRGMTLAAAATKVNLLISSYSRKSPIA